MKKNHINALILAVVLGMGVAVTGCTTFNAYTGESQVSDTTIGAGVGAASGALVGNLIGKDTGATLIGAGVGALAGGMIGNYMDNQEAMLRERLRSSGVQVVRVGGDIRLVMPGDITFANDEAYIRSDFHDTLNSVAMVLQKFNKTNVRIAGYASSTGLAVHNQELSERRAQSVADYLANKGVNPNRLMAVGYGARNPVASNKTLAGQARNRRVEITIHQVR